jgi:hypothetical protein
MVKYQEAYFEAAVHLMNIEFYDKNFERSSELGDSNLLTLIEQMMAY